MKVFDFSLIHQVNHSAELAAARYHALDLRDLWERLCKVDPEVVWEKLALNPDLTWHGAVPTPPTHWPGARCLGDPAVVCGCRWQSDLF